MGNQIPKKIHYCWFGKNEMPQSALSCIETWKEHFKNYELVLWNEDNFDITSNQYVKEAYDAKKWAFVTDYVRLFALYHYGGIYMDTDVRVFKNLDRFLEHGYFSGYESKTLPEMIPTGIIGAIQYHPFCRLCLEEYDHLTFIKEDGTMDFTTNVVRITEMANKQYGFTGNGEYQVFGEDIHIYPYDYFSGFNGERPYGSKDGYDITENTYTIHEFAGSWVPQKRVKKLSAWVKIRNFLRGK